MFNEVTSISTMEPEEITVIVHGARGLQGKKPGRHKYSVIFGLGGKKYRTDVVKDPTGCPDWNEESTIKVYNAEDNVFFTVTEKEDILGHLSFPVMSLQTTKGRVIKASLQPHRKCPAPQGELIYQLYISKCRNLDGSPVIKGNTMTNEPTRPLRGFAKLKHNLATKPLLPHKFHRTKHSGSGNKSSTLSNLNKKFSQSLHDLFNISRGVVVDNEDSDDEGSISVKPAMNGHLRSRAVSVNYMEEIGQEPELTAVTPSEAPTTGGTQLVIIGKHLGAELAEISRLSICGCDCLDTLDYESPMRLYCRTKQWKAGKGDVVIETLSGGSHVLKNYFTFVQKGPVLDDIDGLEESSTTDPPVILNGNTPNGETTGPSESLSSQNFKLGKSMPNLTDMGKDTDGDQKKPLFIRKSNETTDNKYTKNKKDGKGVKQHQRRSSEATAFTRDDNNRRSWSKSELVGEIKKLEEENKQLKHDNDDMKIYIEKLVAKVMIHCPEVLNMADDDEKL